MRYTLQLSGNTSINSQNSSSTFDYDLRKLLPSHLRNKNLIMSSSFHTTDTVMDGNEDFLNDPALLFYYKFDEASANTTFDEVSGAYDAILRNGASLSTADYVVGKSSLSLDSANSQYVDIPTTNTTSGTLNISFWFKTTITAGTILRFGTTSSYNYDIILYVNANYLTGRIRNNSGGTILVANMVAGVNDGVWRHISWNIDEEGHWFLYVNGSLHYSQTTTNAYAFVSTRVNPSLGLSSAWAGYYTGLLDDFRIYDRTLTTDEISFLYNPNYAYSLLSVSSNIPSIYSYSPTSQTLTPMGQAVPKRAYKLSSYATDRFLFSYDEGYKYNINYEQLPSNIIINVSNSNQSFQSTYGWILNLVFFDE